MKLQLNKNKRIGRVVFFVEGDVDEPNLLRSIFCDVLDYHLVVRDKRNKAISEYGKSDDAFSKVFVVPMPFPAIKKLPGDQDFMDEIHRALSAYGLAGFEATTFYLFDRDYRSNAPADVEKKINLLKNPLENGTEMPGALLLSYPCLQAYYCEACGDDACFGESQDAKKYVNINNLKVLSEDLIIAAASSMLSKVRMIRQVEFNMKDLDDYSSITRPVFAFEEERHRREDHKFLTLSLLSLALLDLGILEIKE